MFNIMTANLESEIEILIEHSNDIAEQVRLQNWDQVNNLTLERQVALEAFFSHPIDPKGAKPVAIMIQEILRIDNQLIEFIETEKKNTFSIFADLKSNSKAQKTYQNIAAIRPC